MRRAEPFIRKSVKDPASMLGLRLGLALGVCLLMLVVLQRSPTIIKALAPLDVVIARITAAVLQACGLAVHRDAGILAHPAGFSYKIYYNCTGLTAAAFLSAGLLVLPLPWKTRLAQVLLGAVLVSALNLVRLVSLFYIGVSHLQMFGFFHTVMWNAAMLAFMLGFWLRALRSSGI
jgi:exosortase/archaeosortase family protein